MPWAGELSGFAELQPGEVYAAGNFASIAGGETEIDLPDWSPDFDFGRGLRGAAIAPGQIGHAPITLEDLKGLAA